MSGDVMMFPDTVEEFMESYKIVDREQVYTNGDEFVPIFRMRQWFDHVERSPDDVRGVGKWIPFETRPMDDEEREHWSTQLGYDIPEEEAVIFCSTLPDDGQEILVCNKWGHVWIDTFLNDPDYGVGLETNGDMDGVLAWMPLPEPPKEVE